jgi:hypothetical protein
MKKSLITPKQSLNSNSMRSLNLSLRLSRRLKFFMKYLKYSLLFKKYFLQKKIFFYYTANLFSYLVYFNWLKFFSKKYYTLYFEKDLAPDYKININLSNTFLLTGTTQKSFFFKKFKNYGFSLLKVQRLRTLASRQGIYLFFCTQIHDQLGAVLYQLKLFLIFLLASKKFL